jgi:transposase
MEKKNYWTTKRKVEVVLQLLRGEEIDLLSRKYEVTVADISLWREQFLNHGEDGFKRSPENSKLQKAERLIGQLQMELELIKKKNALIRARSVK